MTEPVIILKKHRRYRLRGERARALIGMFEPLAMNSAFAEFMGSGRLPTITLRVKESTADLSATWCYSFAGGASVLRLDFKDLPLP